MILVGNRRAGAAKLTAHLLNAEDNEHVHVHQIRGFISDDLDGAYHEAYGISRGTRCKKFLYSLSLNPPETKNVSVDIFENAIDRIEQKLGFTGQPRTIVFHEKNARRHAHVVWSRINSDTMTAIDPYQDKLALESIARELFLEYKWEMPPGLKLKEDTDPYNYSHAEHQQAKRGKCDPKQLKSTFAECWERSDSRASFATALKERGLILAKGDRRGFVVVDDQGEVYSVSRWVGIKAKEVRQRLGQYDDLPSVYEAIHQFGSVDQKTHPAVEADLEHRLKLAQLEEKRKTLVVLHRNERSELELSQEKRRLDEIKARAAKLPSGLKAIWSKFSGQYQSIAKENELDAKRCTIRDRDEYQTLIELQLKERRILQAELAQLQQKIDTAPPSIKADPAQDLITPLDPDAVSIKAKVKNNPAYILNVMTDKHEAFSRSDVVRSLAEYITDPLDLGSAIDVAMRSDDLVKVQSKPSPRYSTVEMVELKAALKTCVTKLAYTTDHSVPARYIKSAISQQNKLLNAEVGANLSSEQEQAIRHCLSSDQLSVVIGLAGAGKSTMLSAVREAYENAGYKVHGAALSGKAADGLESSSRIKSRTLASLERSWIKGFGKLTNNDVLVIDEAGMIGIRQMHNFIAAAQKTGAKLILVGDPEQLQPINAGTPFKDIAEQVCIARLTEIHRQKKDWQKQASLDLAEQRIEAALNAYEVHGCVKKYRDNDEAIASLVEDYMADLSLNDKVETRLALAYRRKDVFAINQAIRFARQSAGELENQTLLQTKHGKRAFAPSDRILLTENNHDLGIRNGMLGTVKSVSENELEILFDASNAKNQRKVSINPNLYSSFDHGYATTIHKSQGATVNRTYVLGSHLMDRNLTYVAMTRHKQDATLYGDYNSLRKMQRSGETQSESKHYKQNNLKFSKLLQKRNTRPTMH